MQRQSFEPTFAPEVERFADFWLIKEVAELACEMLGVDARYEASTASEGNCFDFSRRVVQLTGNGGSRGLAYTVAHETVHVEQDASGMKKTRRLADAEWEAMNKLQVQMPNRVSVVDWKGDGYLMAGWGFRSSQNGGWFAKLCEGADLSDSEYVREVFLGPKIFDYGTSEFADYFTNIPWEADADVRGKDVVREFRIRCFRKRQAR